MEDNNDNERFQREKQTSEQIHPVPVEPTKPKKRVRKSKVNPEGEIKIHEVELHDYDNPIVKEISYTQAKNAVPKKAMSDKQLANINKLIELNKIRMDEQKKIKEEIELKAKQKPPPVVVKTIIRPKRIYKKKEQPTVTKQAPPPEFDNYPDDETETETDGTTSEDTLKVRKYVRKIKKIDDELQTISQAPKIRLPAPIRYIPNIYMDALDKAF